jgi:hypothetical protein
VHLYGRGQSRRGPAFKVSLSALLAAKCHPLIDRFVVRDLIESPSSGLSRKTDWDGWSRANPNGRLELYIPAPPLADKTQAFHYHLATRNFFAWVFQRPMVGDHLGGALVALLKSMHEFRSVGEDHGAELLAYVDEEGYLEMQNQPNFALAILYLAELYQMRDLYISAFAHCSGMNERLFMSTEYQVSQTQPSLHSSRFFKEKVKIKINSRLTQRNPQSISVLPLESLPDEPRSIWMSDSARLL